MKIADSIHIDAPIEKVFGVFTDLESASARIKAITKLEIIDGPSSMQVGTKWRETRTLFGKEATEVMWVTELVQNANYAVEAESHGTKYHSKYFFKQNGGATDVEMVFEAEPVSTSARLMSFMGFLFAGATKKALHKDLEDLKAVCEK
ncbi:MAG TPA: SRPBCC family protein [Candidatus Saccharimonadia bacterium]